MKTLSGIIAFLILSLNAYAQCPTGQTLCGSTCVDLTSDANHCGSCGNTCPPGKVCIGGVCSCPAGFVNCGGVCVDLNTDVNHCGACGNACPTGKVCIGGICSTCPGGSVDCNGTCIDLNTDANHCGACGNACPTGYFCDGGSCKPGTSTGIPLLNNDPSTIFVYPNPVAGLVNIRAEAISEGNVSIRLLDTKGSPVSTDLQENTSVDKGIVNILIPEDLAPGIYFIHLESKHFNKILKINKQ